jgi:cyclopropane fatty-acyl-phospholipid synthase-like methyltransferase
MVAGKVTRPGLSNPGSNEARWPAGVHGSTKERGHSVDVNPLIREHYAGDDLAERLLAAAREHSDHVDPTWLDLAPFDHLHAGGLPATRYLLGALDLATGMRVLDVGCDIGGTARCVAADFGGPVTGVDLSSDFVRAARLLTERVGLGDRARFVTTEGDLAALVDDSIDRATLVHVGMNVPNKAALFAEVYRVLAPGGRFGLFEQVRVGAGELPYPMPWAGDERSSFVATVDEYRDALETSGFQVDAVEDRTAVIARTPPTGPGPGVVFGPEFAERIGNNMAATQAGTLAAVMILASRR